MGEHNTQGDRMINFQQYQQETTLPSRYEPRLWTNLKLPIYVDSGES